MQRLVQAEDLARCVMENMIIIHGYLRKKAAINSNIGRDDDRINQGGLKCVSVSTGTNVISMMPHL